MVQVPAAVAVTTPLSASTVHVEDVVPYRTGSPEEVVADTVAPASFTAGEGAGPKAMVCGRASIRGPWSQAQITARAAARRRAGFTGGVMAIARSVLTGRS
jgi:hypothetical protein